MKIPRKYFDRNDKRCEEMLKQWFETATQLSMEYGVLTEVKIEEEFGGTTRTPNRWETIHPEQIVRMFFQIGDKQFEGSNAARAALKNKAFL